MTKLAAIEALIAAAERAYLVDELPDEDDISSPPSGITMGMIRDARKEVDVMRNMEKSDAPSSTVAERLKEAALFAIDLSHSTGFVVRCEVDPAGVLVVVDLRVRGVGQLIKHVLPWEFVEVSACNPILPYMSKLCESAKNAES